MKRYSFHIVVIGFFSATALATLVSVPSEVMAMLLLLGIALGGVSYRHRFSPDRLWPGLLAALCMVSAVAVWRVHEVHRDLYTSPLETAVNSKITIEGVIIKEPEVREKSMHLYVRTEDDTLLVTTNPFTSVSYGDKVSVSGTLKTPASFTTDNGREFDYPHYLLARDVVYTISYAAVEPIGHGEGNALVTQLLNAKHRLMSGIEHAIPEPAAGLGEGLLLGVRQGLGEELNDVFRDAGIVHIVVLSGYNIMLIISFTLFLLARVLPRQARLLTALALVTLFALLVGLSATVVRASLMAGLFLVASLLYRSYDLSRALLLAGAVMVFLSPYLLLFDIGFQLSFVATLGLILVAPKLELLIDGGVGFKEYLIATVATQLAVLPLLLYSIGEISLIAIVTNLLVLPMVPVAMLLTFVTGLVALVSLPLALPTAFLATLSLMYIIKIATVAAALPFAAVTVPYFPIWLLIFSYAVMAFLLTRTTKLHFKKEFKTTVADWVIEEESAVKAGSGHSPLPATTEPPIFFR